MARGFAYDEQFGGSVSMRVIRGKFKGRRLLSPKGHTLRPTTDMVKESIFNILGGQVQGIEVLDLFAGTGSLSIEAFSQGASKVVSVEKHTTSLNVLFNNLKQLDISKEQIQVYKTDVFVFLKRHQKPFDLILIDPPFTKKIADLTMQRLSESKVFKKGTIIVIESSQHENIQDQYGLLSFFDRRFFSDKVISFFK